ncbi:MAG: preprotein translocase subunit YajC [Lachnospiraceae bacterium]|nr:preprotein translocase subunit YajC [Lachnospiraceae bacterium]
MNFIALLTDTAAANPASSYILLLWIPILFVFMYFTVIRPQKKEQKKRDELISSLAVGDSVVTTSGFFGTVIAMPDDDVIIVEFGNNKNCRIPMRKTAIVEVEKPEGSTPAVEEKKEEKKEENK